MTPDHSFLRALFPDHRERPPFRLLHMLMYRNTARVEYPGRRRSGRPT